MFNNKIILGLFFSLLIYLFYSFIYKNKNDSEKEIVENFISSKEFSGKREGYIFKNDEQGLGYYLDKIE